MEGKHCKECQQMKDKENAEFNSNMQDIGRIKSEFEPLRRNIIDAMILCLWDDSKQTKQWESQFSNQLDKAIGLLEKIQMDTPHLQPSLPGQEAEWRVQHYQSDKPKNSRPESGTLIFTVVEEEVAKLGKALQPLIQSGTGLLSLNQLAEDIIQYVKTGAGSMCTIRQELLDLLWKEDWKPANSMTDDSLAKIDTIMVAHAIATDIQFNDIKSREEAIPKSFETTYSWIFQNEPPMKNGMPLWDSFPKWFEGDSNKVYWITGKPGSGKSTMMKLILKNKTLWNDLSQSLGALRLLLIQYYAWHPGNVLQKSLQGLKRTVIFQALTEFPELTPVLSPRRWAFCQALRSISGLPKWTDWEIEESFEALLSSCGKTIKLALFIDGLDEFNMPPAEIVNYIKHIRARCGSGLKLCAASRPWTEFQDEFNESPMLQMHLHTYSDMKIFINGKFGDNKAFAEQKQLYPDSSSQLLTDIAERANGVFIWLSIVVQRLLGLLSEGQSINQARKDLEALPTDILSLYSTIWGSIQPKNLPDASYMMQVLRAADGPFRWFKMWLIEESRFTSITANNLPKDENSKNVALKSLKRKLAARTKCILEVSGTGSHAVVDFIHRTARDWAVQPEMWQLIYSSLSEEFDPHLCILKAEGIMFEINGVFSTTYFWDTAIRMFWHAGEAKDTPENRRDIVHSLDSLYKGNERSYGRFLRSGDIEREIYPTFLGLAARFSVLSYIRAVVLSDRRCLYQDVSKYSIGLLENAIFGYAYYGLEEFSEDGFRPKIPYNRRLATVRYLLEEGVYQSGIYSKDGKRNIKREIQRVSQDDSEYYSTVMGYLDTRSFRSRVKSLELRFMSFFSKIER
ncbi:hypothetical protein V8C40DRAFT_275326 [Trichoderma camerunense]